MSKGLDGYQVQLQVDPHTSHNTTSLHITMMDEAHHRGSAVVDMSEFVLPGNVDRADFLKRYRRLKLGKDEEIAFGRALFDFLMSQESMRQAWGKISSAAQKKPLDMTIAFAHKSSEHLARLPLELLHDPSGFLFMKPGSGLTRALLEMPPKEPELGDAPHVLFAWANPPGAGDAFEPDDHRKMLEKRFPGRVTEVGDASIEKIKTALSTKPRFEIFHLMAHGFVDRQYGGVALCSDGGGIDFVPSQRLADLFCNKGGMLAFLASCKSAVTHQEPLTGVGQQLLYPTAGDFAVVVATQANLPVRGSAELADSFYHFYLQEKLTPGAALALARERSPQANRAWSVPILLARPALIPRSETQPQGHGLPPQRETWLERPQLEEIIAQVTQHCLVSVVGLPGIGKTELGKEAARKLMDEGHFQQLVFRSVAGGMSLDLLRAQIGADLGSGEKLESDEQLAHLLNQKTTLLLLDNAEDLMMDGGDQVAFRAMLDRLLLAAPHLKILLTTRWAAGSGTVREYPVPVGSLSPEDTEALLIRELQEYGSYREEWTEQPAWKELLGFLDGLPRAVALVANQFDNPLTRVDDVVARLQKHQEKAIVDASLLGSAKIVLTDAEDNRMKSLAASMESSYLLLLDRFPKAHKAFLQLSLFPHGLPQRVARAVVEDEDSHILETLYRYHMMEWHQQRTRYPVPLLWYAQRHAAGELKDPNQIRTRALAAYFAEVRQMYEDFVGGEINRAMSRWFEEVTTLVDLAKHYVPQPGAYLGLAVARAGNMIRFAHDLETAKLLLKKGIEDARQTKNGVALSGCLEALGDFAMRTSDLERAASAYGEALLVYKEIKDRLGEANCLNALGDLAMRRGDLEEAERAYGEALAVYKEIKGRRGEANCLWSLGELAMRTSDLDGAERVYGEALAVYKEIKDRIGEANCLQSMGLLLLERNKAEEAFKKMLEADAIHKSLENALGRQAVKGYLAWIAASLGQPDRALLLAEKSLHIGRQIKDKYGILITLGFQAEFFTSLEDQHAARGTMLLHHQLATDINDKQMTAAYAEPLATLRKDVGEEAWKELDEHKEAFRQQGIQAARARFGDGDPMVL